MEVEVVKKDCGDVQSQQK